MTAPTLRPLLLLLATACALAAGGCGKPEPQPPRELVEQLMSDMQERAFDRMYAKLTAARRREVSLEEYVRYNSAGFDKLEGAGGALEGWQVEEVSAAAGSAEAKVEVLARIVFQATPGPSEHRRRLVFQLYREADEWKFDSFKSYEVP